MKSIRLFFLIHLSSIAANGWAQGYLRTYDLPGSGEYISEIITVTVTPDGGFLFYGSDNVAKKWLVKTDPLGEAQWMREISNLDSDVQADIYASPNGNYALGNYIDAMGAPNSFLLFDQQGNQLVRHDFPGFARVVMTDNGFLVSNRVSGSTYKLFGLNWQGDIVWEKTHATTYLGFLYDMTASEDGGLCMMVSYDSTGGRFPKLIKANANGDIEWERVYKAGDLDLFGRILQNAQGRYIFSNHNNSSSGSNIFAANSNGDSLWSTSTSVLVFGLSESANDGYAFTGETLLPGGISLSINLGTPDNWDYNTFSINNAWGAGRDVHATPDGGLVLTGHIGFRGVLIKSDANGNIYPNFITGKARFDQNHDCQVGANEPPLKNWTIVATETSGQEYYTTTNDTGYYELNVNIGNYTLEIHPPGPLWEPCNTQYAVDLSTPPDTVNLDFPVQDSVLCSLLDVSIGTPFLRRCFDGQYYVSWCNQGTAAAFDTYIEIVLPPELDFLSATPIVPVQSGDTLFFDIGTVGWGECGTLQFKVNVDCDSTVLGQTLCVEASIFPDTICYETQNWSGARVAVSARCLADTAVEFRLLNAGPAPTQTLDYIITEDLVVLMQGSFDLAPLEEQVIMRDANGSVQRLEAEQEPGYPLQSMPSAFVEGCGNPPLSFGYANQFPLDDAGPFTDIECREVLGSYDPNDKQGFPVGYGTQHSIEPGADITYLIRFQNTGTDTAFTVTIRDTLSAWLDPATVRPGAASHPFTWELSGSGALAFHFDQIMLPDSNVNEPASHGFIQFRIAQRADVPLGTIIENAAAIFFDYNAPVITNTTFHTVSKDFYTVSIENPPVPGLLQAIVSPNPFRQRAIVTLPEALPGTAVFRVFDQSRRTVQEIVFSGNTFDFPLKNRSAGLYFFEIQDDSGQIRSRGKIIIN